MKAFLLMIGLAGCMHGFAQQDYFVLIQSEKNQPFYVRVGEKTHSSSAIGHLILSNLKDTAYTIAIGFPRAQFPEQEFVIRISRKDRGYELKNLGEKGWALFDTYTMELIPPVKAKVETSGGTSYIKKDDSFAKLMARVVNDTAVLYAVVIEKPAPVMASNTAAPVNNTMAVPDVPRQETGQKELPKPQTTELSQKIEPKVDSTLKATEEIVKIDKPKQDTVVAKTIMEPPVKTPEVVTKEPEQKPVLPVINVLSRQATDSGYHMLIADGGKDSIDIFIPAEKSVAFAEKKQEPENKSKAEPAKDSGSTVVNSKHPIDTLVVAPSVKPVVKDTVVKMDPVPEAKKEPVLTDTQVTQPKKLVMMNSDCRMVALSSDVDKLRVKLVREKDAESRIAAAKKVFRTKCFTAAQVKALSELFPFDEQKYHFLETAYPFVYDTSAFKELTSLLKDPIYVQRFRKLVRLD